MLISWWTSCTNGGRIAARALQRVGDAARQARDEARGRLSHKSVAADLKRAAKKLDAIAAKLEDADAGRASAARLALGDRRARRAPRGDAASRPSEAGAVYLPERLHAVRIALKKLRYGLELSVGSRRRQGRRPTRALLKRIRTLLGRLHDLQVLIERVRQVQASLTPPDLAGVARARRARSRRSSTSCRRLHARYVRDRVGA